MLVSRCFASASCASSACLEGACAPPPMAASDVAYRFWRLHGGAVVVTPVSGRLDLPAGDATAEAVGAAVLTACVGSNAEQSAPHQSARVTVLARPSAAF